jgi:hypothetical protein
MQQKTGWASAPAVFHSASRILAAAKAGMNFGDLSARLKSCPDTKRIYETLCSINLLGDFQQAATC